MKAMRCTSRKVGEKQGLCANPVNLSPNIIGSVGANSSDTVILEGEILLKTGL